MTAALILAASVLAYSNTFRVPFLFDDIPEIVENLHIRDLRAFLTLGAGYEYNPNRFVSYLTLALNYRAGGLDVAGYHVFNLAVHAFNALLVYWLVSLVYRTPVMARSPISSSARAVPLFSSLLFLLHPVQTQAVTYIVQRMTSLAALFYLLAIGSYLRFRLRIESGSSGRGPAYALYALSLLSTVLAMKTKEIAMTLPVMIAVVEYLFFPGGRRGRILVLAPYAVALCIIPLTLIDLGEPFGDLLSDVSKASRVQSRLSRWDYFITQLCVVNTYIRLLVCPIRQNLDYDYPVFHGVGGPRVWVGAGIIMVLVSVALGLLIKGKKESDGPSLVTSFGIFWFFISLSVESSVIPIADVIFEHRVYLPSVGAFAAVSSAILALAGRRRRAGWARALPAAGLAVLLLLGVATHRRNAVWAEEVTFWEDVVAKSPGKARPHVNLGVALAQKDRRSDAVAHFHKAIEIDPGYARAYANLGAALAGLGRVEDAVGALGAALRLDSGQPEPYYNLGRIYLVNRHMTDASIEMFREAIRLKPNYIDAHVNLAAAYIEKGMFDEAIAVLMRVEPHTRGRAEARANLAIAHYGRGNFEAARAELEEVSRLNPRLAPRVADKLRTLRR